MVHVAAWLRLNGMSALAIDCLIFSLNLVYNFYFSNFWYLGTLIPRTKENMEIQHAEKRGPVRVDPKSVSGVIYIEMKFVQLLSGTEES